MIPDVWLLYRGRIVAIVVLLAINLGLFVAAVRPATEAARGRDAGRTRDAASAGARAEEARLAETRRRADALVAAFPVRTDLLGVAGRLQAEARRLGLTVPAVDYRPDARTAAGQPLDRTGLRMRIEGRYAALRRLLHAAEREGRSVVVDVVALRAGAAGGVQMALELSTYSRLTVPAVAPPASSADDQGVPELLAALVDRPAPPYPPEVRDLFSRRQVLTVRQAPRPAVAVPTPEAAPSLPLLATTPAPETDGGRSAPDLRLLGTSGGGAGQRAFVSLGGEVLVVRRGDRVGADYVVREIAPEWLVLRSRDGEREITLGLGEGARHAP